MLVAKAYVGKSKINSAKNYLQLGLNLGPWDSFCGTSCVTVQHSPFWTDWAFACRTETLGSLHGHALLIPTK